MVQKNNLNKILIICGPTASGKTALAVECAKLLDTEVVSADSMCIYKDLNIGTAKPTIDERKEIKHHLIDVVEPKESFTVSDYKSLAKPIVDRLISCGKIPIVCGGTGFYIDSLLYDLSYGKGIADLQVREKYKKLAEEKGNEYVYSVLCEVDKKSAEKIHSNDLKRVIRALEIFESGTKKSDIIDNYSPLYDYSAYCVDYPREELYERINKRVDLMFDNGLVEEVERLIDSGVTVGNQCMQGIGYKEVYAFLKKEISYEECVEKIKINTRHYAKRQLTYFKRLQNLTMLQPKKTIYLAKEIVDKL